MTVKLAGSDPRDLFTHLLAYGLVAICEDAGIEDLLLSWTPGMTPRPQLESPGLSPVTLGDVVRAHAAAHNNSGWLRLDLPQEPGRGLFSPRIKPPQSPQDWETLLNARRTALDDLATQGCVLDLRFLAGLGEPAAWRQRDTWTPLPDKDATRLGTQLPPGQRPPVQLPDEGATRLDMQPRNQGSEIVSTRLRPLAAALAARAPQQVTSGLLGDTLIDDVGGTRTPDSRGAANLRRLGPTDSAQTWAALWGIALIPIAHRARRSSRTATHVPRERDRGGPAAGTFGAPVWQGCWRPARLRGVLRSAQLASAIATLSQGELLPSVTSAWLQGRGVRAIWTFPVGTFGSKSAPERRALDGQLHRLAGR